MKQYRGSADIDGSTQKALTVRNITYEMIESQVSSHIPPPKVDPTAYSEKKVRLAQSVERLLSAVRDKLPYEQMNVEQLQAVILAKMEKNGNVTDRMRRDVTENIWHDSLVNWAKSF